MIPNNIRILLQNNNIAPLINYTSNLPPLNYTFGNLNNLLRLTKFRLIELTQSCGYQIGNTQCKKHILILMLILRLPYEVVRHYDWIWRFSSGDSTKLDALRYLFQYYFNDTIPNIFNLPNDFRITTTESLRHKPCHKMTLLFSLLFFSVVHRNNNQNNLRQFANECSIVTFDIINEINTRHLATPSRSHVTNTHRNVTVVDKIPEHIKTDYIRMFCKLQSDTCCPICLNDMSGNLIMTNCGHLFHTDCLEQVPIQRGGKLCPTCRKII